MEKENKNWIRKTNEHSNEKLKWLMKKLKQKTNKLEKQINTMMKN